MIPDKALDLTLLQDVIDKLSPVEIPAHPASATCANASIKRVSNAKIEPSRLDKIGLSEQKILRSLPKDMSKPKRAQTVDANTKTIEETERQLPRWWTYIRRI